MGSLVRAAERDPKSWGVPWKLATTYFHTRLGTIIGVTGLTAEFGMGSGVSPSL